jgi:pentatricopeptide repeat protein
MDACLRFNDTRRCLAIYGEMIKAGVTSTPVTYGILIKAYGV